MMSTLRCLQSGIKINKQIYGLHGRYRDIDEDIPTLVPTPPHDDEQPVAAKKVSNDEIRI